MQTRSERLSAPPFGSGMARLSSLVIASVVWIGIAGTGAAPSGASPPATAAPQLSVHLAGSTRCTHKASSTGGVTTVPLTITGSPTGKLITIGVCIGAKGPYRFVADTGSSRSIIDTKLAAALSLKGAGTADLGGSGCATTGTLVKVPTFRMAGISLAPQAMVSSSLSDWGGASVDGVLGSDVFGRFGAVKLDLKSRTLAVAGVEGRAPTSHQLVVGRPGSSPPRTLFSGKPSADVPLSIIHSAGHDHPFGQREGGRPGALCVHC